MEIQNGYSASFSPETGKRGEKVSLAVTFDGLTFNPEKAVIRIPAYGLYEVLRPAGEGKFTWSYMIPSDAPLRSYEIELYALDSNGTKGPIHSFNYAVA